VQSRSARGIRVPTSTRSKDAPMHRSTPFRGLRVQMIAISLPLALAWAAPSLAANQRHHLGLALGYQKFLSDDLKDEGREFSTGHDYANAGVGSISYRFSMRRNFDLTLDACGTASTTGYEYLALFNSFFGPGVRIISPNEGIRPFVQANFFLVHEEVLKDSGYGVTLIASNNGAGFGVSGGLDIRAGDLVSLPVTVDYMYGQAYSGIGINTGLTFNFGAPNR
jgi:hypothetical protein